MTKPIRVRSAKGHPRPNSEIERRCHACGASFLGLAPGKTGERGLWDDWHWYCSIECTPPAVLEQLEAFARGLTKR